MKSVIGLTVFGLLAARSLASLPTYTLIDLGPCNQYDGPSINASGHVAFTSAAGAAVWANGVATPVPLGIGNTGAKGINSFNDVAGYFNDSSPAARINGATITLSSYVVNGYARAVNDNRSVLIQSASGPGTYLWHGGSAVSLTGSGGVQGEGLNNLDQVVGEAQLGGVSNYRAYMWTNGVFTTLNPPGIPDNNFSAAYGINDSGTIVGEYELSSSARQPWRRAADGTFTLLGQPPSNDLVDPLAVNSSNLVVGFYRQTAGGYRAVVWDGATAVPLTTYINRPGWTLERATGVNDAGQIVGSGTFGGVTHGFILNPVPAPSTAVVFMGGAALAFRRRRA